MLATLCGSASCCVLLGTLWYWSRTRKRGKRYIPALQQRCKYRCEDRMENEVLKTHVMWEIDPKALSMFCGNDLGQRDLEGADSLYEDAGHGHTLVARAQEHVDLELADVQAGTLGEFSSSLVSTGTSSSSVVQANSRLALRSGRHLSTVLHDVIPMGNLIPAYAHMSHVEYYSCTHHLWLPAVVTFDALDHHTHGTHRTEEVIYAVHLCRTQQFRNHVPLHHLRRPLAAGHLVEVLTGRGCAWQEARIQKLALGKTDRFYVVELQGQHITVPASSTRRRFPEGCEVLVYQGCTSGWQAGVVRGVVSGASWNPTSSESQSAFVVTRALKPHPGDAVTDFSFVPDSRVFAVEIAGKIHSSIPAHLLSIEVSDELP